MAERGLPRTGWDSMDVDMDSSSKPSVFESLPNEILCEIFDQFSALHLHPFKTTAALRLSHISRHWRVLVCEAMPRLWSFPALLLSRDLLSQSALIQLALKRSRETLLHVYIDCTKWSTSTLVAHAAPLALPLFQSASRWTHATLLSLPPWFVTVAHDTIRGSTGPLLCPNLSTLETDCWDDLVQIIVAPVSLFSLKTCLSSDRSVRYSRAPCLHVVGEEASFVQALPFYHDVQSLRLDAYTQGILPPKDLPVQCNAKSFTLATGTGRLTLGHHVSFPRLETLAHIDVFPLEPESNCDYPSFLSNILIPLTSSGFLTHLTLSFNYRWRHVSVENIRHLFTTNLHALRTLEIRQTLLTPLELFDEEDRPVNPFKALLPPDHVRYPFRNPGLSRPVVLPLPALRSLRYHLDMHSDEEDRVVNSRPDIFNILETLEEVVLVRMEMGVGLEEFEMRTEGIDQLKVAFFVHRMERFEAERIADDEKRRIMRVGIGCYGTCMVGQGR
ncbi:hypothetical protein DL96DRAFT_1625868 [Flagelloscypha sp. PMI_526]|nr:hypothetical protein DL96DRAFT_1625868 [Flagelloscypha sp. PMI_526]